MLNDDEAVIVALGVVGGPAGAGRLGGVGRGRAREDPPRPSGPVRRRVEALETTLDFTTAAPAGAPVAGETVLLLADAIRRRRRLRISYRAFSGEATRRDVSPHGLVVHSGRWYLAAFDHVRDDLRTFRVDHAASTAQEAAVASGRIRCRCASGARSPVRRAAARGRSAARPLAGGGDPAPTSDSRGAGGSGRRHTVRMRVSSLDWMARILAGLDCPFTILKPEEPRTCVGWPTAWSRRRTDFHPSGVEALIFEVEIAETRSQTSLEMTPLRRSSRTARRSASSSSRRSRWKSWERSSIAPSSPSSKRACETVGPEAVETPHPLGGIVAYPVLALELLEARDRGLGRSDAPSRPRGPRFHPPRGRARE